jgi:hypothetical protein
MRYLERRPARTKLQRKVVTAVNIAPETITADEVSFGTAVITTETDLGNVVVDNPKDGLLIVSSTNGSSSVYSETNNDFIPITDTVAQDSADAAAADAAQAASDAALAEAAAQQALDDAAAADAAAVAAQEVADQAVIDAKAADDAAFAAAEAAAAADDAAAQAAEDAAAAQETGDQAILDAFAAQQAADAAADEALAATESSLLATESANKKNSVFRAPASAYAPASAPTANSVGDIWFDTTPLTADVTQGGTAAGGARPKRWDGDAWQPFGLSYAAITSLDADTITAGTLTGRTVRTSASGNRVEMSNTDVISFYNNAGTTVGTIQPGFGNEGLILTAGSGGSSITMTGSGWADDSAMILSTSQGSGNITMFDDTYDGESGGGMFITGNSLVIQGTNGWEIKDAGAEAAIYGTGGTLLLSGGQSSINLTDTDIYLSGDLVLSVGTYVQGTGAPTEAATEGTIIFKYV